MITLKNIVKKYGEKTVFDGLNLEIEKGKITAILGENGSGKTTLTNILLNLTDFSGEVLGVPNVKSVVFQEDRLVKNLTVKENVRLVTGEPENPLLEKFGLKEKEDRFIKELSGGEKRKVALIRALSYPAPLLILDEPFSSIDIASKNAFIEHIKAENKDKKNTVIFITHDILEAVMLADRIVVLKGGNIVFDEEDFDKKSVGERIYALLSNPR